MLTCVRRGTQSLKTWIFTLSLYVIKEPVPFVQFRYILFFYCLNILHRIVCFTAISDVLVENRLAITGDFNSRTFTCCAKSHSHTCHYGFVRQV